MSFSSILFALSRCPDKTISEIGLSRKFSQNVLLSFTSLNFDLTLDLNCIMIFAKALKPKGIEYSRRFLMTLVRIGDAPPDEIAICIGSLLTTDGIRTLPFIESSAVLIKISHFFASSKACLFVLLSFVAIIIK